MARMFKHFAEEYKAATAVGKESEVYRQYQRSKANLIWILWNKGGVNHVGV